MDSSPTGSAFLGFPWKEYCRCSVSKSSQVIPWMVARQALLFWDFPGKNIGVSYRFLLQGIFPTQGLNPCLRHWQADSSPLSLKGSPLWILMLLCNTLTFGVDRIRDLLLTKIHFCKGIKTILMEKKCKKAKSLSGEALQIAVKRREAKSKGEKERYTHLKAEFQRIARRDKKTFLSEQWKE